MTILYVIKLSNKEILKLQNCIEYILTKTEIRIVIESTYTGNGRTKINKQIHLIKTHLILVLLRQKLNTHSIFVSQNYAIKNLNGDKFENAE